MLQRQVQIIDCWQKNMLKTFFPVVATVCIFLHLRRDVDVSSVLQLAMYHYGKNKQIT